MISLVILACLIDDPAKCREFEVKFEEEVTMQQCVQSSMINLTHWFRENENWKIEKFKCIESSKKETEI